MDSRKLRDARLKRELLKLSFLAFALSAPFTVLWLMPGLFVPSLLGLVLALLLSPFSAWLERKNFSHDKAIALVFGSFAAVIALGTVWLGRSVTAEWDSFMKSAPGFIAVTLDRMAVLESQIKVQYPSLQSFELVASFVTYGRELRAWFLQNGAGLAGNVLQNAILGPFLAFVLLQSGPLIWRRFLSLVPNRFFEPSFMATTRILGAFTDYLRAKILEAVLVGLICLVGFVAVGAPYAGGLALFAGLTNILPYVGPFIGAVPCILVTALDPATLPFFWPVMVVYGVSQVLDTFVIFPVVVARLVNLHPLFVILAVMAGQQFYGLVGMLISVPIVTAIKIIVQEVHGALYRSDEELRSS